MKTLILLIATTLFPLAATAQVYTWTDANGRVHFSDKAPAHRKVQTVDLPQSSSQSVAPDVDEAERMARQKRLVQALEDERLEKERQKAQAQAEVEKKLVYCERFKNRMDRMESASRLYSENKDGTIRYWDDNEADRTRKELRARYLQECGQA